jgi:predicted N-acetyltransferase YhbS
MVQQPAGTVSGDIAIRRYGPADLPALVDLIGGAFGGETPESVRFAVSARNTTTFITERDGHVAGVAMAVSFGATAWIANVVVAADCRRQGLGTALTEAACAAARERASTVLLLALGDAQRIYARLGFVPEGLYGTWQASTATARLIATADADDALPVVAANEPGLVAQAAALDQRATGEDRGPYLELFAPSMRVVVRRDAGDPVVVGCSTRMPWGTGAVVADDASAANVLLCDLLRLAPQTRFEFPDANEAGVRVATELGLERFKENLRMRLGPAVAGFQPSLVYKALSPAVG